MTLAIASRDLTYEYAPGVGAISLDLEVASGTVYGLLGPNGAGKSTAIRMLAALIKPHRGSLTALGLNPWSQPTALHARMGVLLAHQPPPRHHTGTSLLELLAKLHRRPDINRRGTELAERLGLDLSKNGHQLSVGNQQKLGLVTALAHEPELIILDEPTNGLDPLLQREIGQLLREMADNGRTVVLSSHSLPDVEAVATHVGFIRDARLVEHMPLAALAERSVRRLTLTFDHRRTAADFDGLSNITTVQCLDHDAVSIEYRGAVAPLLIRAGQLGAVTIEAHPVELEEAFLALYRGES